MSTNNEGLINDDMSRLIIETTEKLATGTGAKNVTVRSVLRELGITNRVFYNRFHNIDEVLTIVYKNTILKIRKSLVSQFDPAIDFFKQVIDIVTKTLVMSYDNKMRFNNYVFENDSISKDNYEWWTKEITQIIEYAKSKKLVKNLDSKMMSYSIWCFIRGYNADAVGREVPKQEAVDSFKYSFGVLLDGMKA